MTYEKRMVGNSRVDAVRIPLEVTEELLSIHKHGEYTEVLECYLVLYAPPKQEILQCKLDEIAAVLPDEIAAKHPDIYQKLTGSGLAVNAGDRRVFGDNLYKANVTVWDRPDQWPDAVPELWMVMPKEGEYRTIPNQISATETFSYGEIGRWIDGLLYKSIHPYPHAWTPKEYPPAWELYKP